MPEDPVSAPAGDGQVGPAMLDHVAVAVEQWADAWPRYAVDLGGAWSSGGLNVGFGPAQLRFANGARLEVLQPWKPEANPFLRRFLDTNGPGPHHLTFKVTDLDRALDAAAAGGFDPVGVDRSDPTWQEAFLHPRQATGIVVQLAQAAGEWVSPPPEGFPTDRRYPPASLEHVTHAVADLGPALALFRDLLGGTVRGQGTDGTASRRFVDLGWSGPLALRLVGPADGNGERSGDGGGRRAGALAAHLAGRPGRVHHLRLAVPEPWTVPGTVPCDGDGDVAGASSALGVGDEPAWLVEPADNLGARLVLVEGR
ncbi:MAG TPA: VOC family protein [Acidimicrobiales bacterium]|nr:VOC family protein [Acidimicrobiales bacterium]